MRKEHIVTASRVLLGLIFFVFGLNGFLQFLPMPPPPDRAAGFIGALAATGYMFPLIKGTEVIAGALLLANRFVPLSLALLAPIVVNIVLLHTFLTPVSPIAIAVLALELGLAWAYRDAFRGMLQGRVTPRVAGDDDASSRHPAAAHGA